MTEVEMSAKLYAWQKEGMACRRNGGSTPYAGNTVAHAMHSSGWLQEDLRIALMKADARYRASQPDGNKYVT